MTNETSADEERLNPRTRRVRQLILDAAVEVLLSQGAHEVTATRVAERADVARTTIYRHWPEQSSFLLATIDALVAPHFPATSAGDIDTDLRADLENLRTRLVTREVRPVFAALAAHAASDDVFVAAQRRFIDQMTQPVVDTLRAGQERGELSAQLDCRFEADLLTAPLFHVHLVALGDIDDRVIDEIADRWLATGQEL